MSHLTEEQFEDILQGRANVLEHMDRCPQCRARLEEKRALVDRLRQSFSSIHAGADLAGRIRARIAAAGQPAIASTTRLRILPLRVRRHVWSVLAVAAAIFVIAIPRSLHIDTGPRTTAARTALAGIHFANLDSLDHMMADENSGKHCPCAEGKLEGGMAMPCCQRGLCICGCQMREFQGRWVESCVIQEPNAPPLSVVVVSELPHDLGMTPAGITTSTGQPIWRGSCGSCNMASVRVDEQSCCVIGQVPTEDLVAVLNALGE